MKKFALLQLSCIALLLSSCASDVEDTVGLVDTYRYEITDTVISADSHVFSIAMTGDDQPKDWQSFGLWIWDGHAVPEEIDPALFVWPANSQQEVSYEGNTIGLDWIELEKVVTATSPAIKIIVRENDTNRARGIKFIFGNEWENGKGAWSGQFMIVQQPQH